MEIIANKIRTLRKNKNMTQEQLAEILSVSSQAVSKWENSISVPDVELLPIIARYFGITMDEFFNYRLDALNYKERFIRFMADNGVLKFGQFSLLSDRISPYYIDTANYKSASQLTKLGRFYAECIIERNIPADLLYGNTIREVPLLIASSMVLYDKYGLDVHYNAENIVGANLSKAKNIVVIEDTLTSGSTLIKTLEMLQTQASGSHLQVLVSVDRMEMSAAFPGTAANYIEKNFNAKVHSIVSLTDIISAIKNGIISDSKYLDHLIKYQNIYGGESYAD